MVPNVKGIDGDRIGILIMVAGGGVDGKEREVILLQLEFISVPAVE